VDYNLNQLDPILDTRITLQLWAEWQIYMALRALLVSLLIAVAFADPSVAASKRPVAAEDLFELSFLSSPVMSHDGSRIAYIVSRMDGPKNTYLTNIWIAEASTGRVWQLTRGDSDSSPVWSPDDRWLAFASRRGGKSQIYRVSPANGKTQRLTNQENGAFNPQWSHDGSRILFQSVTIDKVPAAYIDFKAAGFTPSEEQRQSDIHIITIRHYEDNGQGETYNRHLHLWVMAADGSDAKALTSDNHWSETNPSWSPNDKLVAFNAFHGDDLYDSRDDIYVIPSGGGTARRIPLAPVGNFNPVWGHDSLGLYFFQATTPNPAEFPTVGYPALKYTYLDGSTQRGLIAPYTVSFGDVVLSDMRRGLGCGPLFGPHDRWFIANVNRPGTAAIIQYDVETGQGHTIVGGNREVSDCSMSDDGRRLAFVVSDATHPAEIFVTDTLGGHLRQLTNANANYLATVDLSVPEPFEMKDHAGFTVHAWIMHPPHAVANRRYPTILYIHGAPGEYGNTFYHQFQYLAGLGYNIVYANPRGSVGYGYPFETAINLSWGDAMFDDEMSVVDAVRKRPEVDASRMAVSGISYGGFSTLWIIEHTRFFKAAIAEEFPSNMLTQWLTGDLNIAFDPKYSWGNPWDHFAENWKVSPAAYVANIRTPVMLIHGDADLHTPIGQTLQIYSALKILGRTVEYVEVPRETHSLSRAGEPIHRVERLHIVADWYAKYLGE
jgi:dipeptidyl aminopeptidase/acylaminoacyl peptidase